MLRVLSLAALLLHLFHAEFIAYAEAEEEDENGARMV